MLFRSDGTFVTKKDGERSKLYEMAFTERETGVDFKIAFFQNKDKDGNVLFRVNPNNQELEDDIVKLSRKLGYDPCPDGGFALSDFLKKGVTFNAKLKTPVPKKPQNVDAACKAKMDDQGNYIPASDEKVYKVIDIDTVVYEGGSSKAQQKLPTDNEEDVATVLELMKGTKKFSELVTKINKQKRSSELLEVSMRMKESGKIKF